MDLSRGAPRCVAWRARIARDREFVEDSAVHTHAGSSGHGRVTSKQRLRTVLVLAVAALVVEVAGGFAARSLALLADATHLFADIAALVLAYAAMALAERMPSHRYTFGLYRAEILAAFVNAEMLLVVTGFLFYEAYRRIQSPPEIQTGLMTVVAAVGLATNLVSMAILRRESEHSLNIRAAYLEVVSDALGSFGVLIAAAVMAVSGRFWIDPLVSAAIALVVLPRAISILRQSAHILLEGTPTDVDVRDLRAQLLRVPGVVELHDLHFWTLTSGLHSASVHIRATEESRGEVLREVRRLLRESAGVDHSTIQVESGSEVVCETTDHHA
jgi:cobalt-zinc-cadmium efflux system protein